MPTPLTPYEENTLRMADLTFALLTGQMQTMNEDSLHDLYDRESSHGNPHSPYYDGPDDDDESEDEDD